MQQATGMWGYPPPGRNESGSVRRLVMSDSLQPYGLCPWDSPGKNTGVSYHSLLQGIFLTQGLNLGYLHWKHGVLATGPLGKSPLGMSIAQCLWSTCLPAGVVDTGAHHEINKVPLLGASVPLTLFYWGMVA